MEREGREGRGRGGEKMRGRRGIIVGGITLLLLFGCNNGIAELEKRNSFYESVMKIGQGFQEIFGIFGKAMGESLGFGAIKYGNNKSEVGEHFKKVKQGLESTKNQLEELSNNVSASKNLDGNIIETVKNKIKGAGEVFEQLIGSLTKLVNVTKDTSLLGDTATDGSVPAEEASVKDIIEGVKKIIETAESVGVDIQKASGVDSVIDGNNAGNAPAILTHNSAATADATAKLAEEVSKADPWAMINKIKGSTTNPAKLTATSNYDAGTLATGGAVANGAGAKSNADLAAAVALKAMTKSGKFTAHGSNNHANV